MRIFLVVFLSVIIFGCGQAPSVEQIQGKTMGTYYAVKFWQPQRQVSQTEIDEIHQQIEAVLLQVNQQMSTYIPDSELSLFNKAETDSWIQLSQPLVQLFEVGKQVSQQCDGAFDMTVGPLVNLWGFGPDLKPEKVPTSQDLQMAFANIGSQHLEVSAGKARKLKPLYIDLSAFAKGYGVDKVAEIIASHGFDNYLVDIGGEIKVAGHKPNKFGWRIAVASPDAMLTNKVYRALDLSNMSMATSGDYRNYFEANGIRYSHTIDPKTGYPIKHKLASVTVLDESSMMSDALATCLMVKGEVEGFAWAERNNIAAYFIYREGDGFNAKATSAFEQTISNQRKN